MFGVCPNFLTRVLLCAFLWWFLASALVFVAWNKVVMVVTAAKKMQFAQALLLVLALAVLCAPCMMRHCQGCSVGQDTILLEE